jgi:hypothetical protein
MINLCRTLEHKVLQACQTAGFLVNTPRIFPGHFMKRLTLRSSTALIGALIIAGCAPTINQDNLIRNRFELNGTAMRSWMEQMLLNLVRMRYRDNPMFWNWGTSWRIKHEICGIRRGGIPLRRNTSEMPRSELQARWFLPHPDL